MYKPFYPYHIYILTSPNKKTLYTGVTNNLSARIIEHWRSRNKSKTFAGKYFCYNLIYYESFEYILDAIVREKEIKKWSRKKKDALINTLHPEWNFLNKEICGEWPPKNIIPHY